MPLRKRGLGIFQAARDGDTVVIQADVPQVRRAQGDGQAGLGRGRCIPEGRVTRWPLAVTIRGEQARRAGQAGFCR